MEGKGNARIALALLCGLAICCSVMYVTSDGAETVLYEADGFEALGPRSIESVDVKKAGVIITDTPDGRERLMDYLTKVETMIMAEKKAERDDIDHIRATMSKNFELNAKARKDMKKELLAKMAVNAKKAKDDLDAEMRKVQATFAETEALANQRNDANIARSKKTRDIMMKNKKEAAKALQMATMAQQRALSALDTQTNEKIRQTNKSIAANAAQIKKNAKLARQHLEEQMAAFDKKMSNTKEEAEKGRSKLAAQANAQDKKFRQYAANEVKKQAMAAATEFQKVRQKMADDRAHADSELKGASAKMNAALSAQQALQDKRFESTVKDIAAAKKEASDRVAKAQTDFKVKIANLKSTVEEQVKKVNARTTQLAGVVSSHKLEQAKVNRNSFAEMKRMTELGNERYAEHLKKDKELHDLLKSNKEDTARQMRQMQDSFSEAMTNIKDQMKKDREFQAEALKKSSDGLFKVMMDNKAAQGAMNEQMEAATEQARMDAQDALDNAKADFAKQLTDMHAVAVESAKKQQKAVNDLTGVVEENALKDEAGRNQLLELQKNNKADVNDAISDAIHQGEQQALKLEQNMKDANAKMRQDMNTRITTEIGDLRKVIKKSLFKLSLQTKAARAQMREQVQNALTDAVKKTKDELTGAVTWATGRLAELDATLEANSAANADERKKLEDEIAANKKDVTDKLTFAVEGQNRALLALKTENAAEIKKTNTNLNAAADQMAENAKAAKDQMAADTATLVAKVAAAKDAADAGLAAAAASSVNRYQNALAQVEDGLAIAAKKSEDRFGKLYEDMAADRADMESKYSSSLNELNDAIAQQAALNTEQFTKDLPKQIAEYKTQALNRVANARKTMKTELVALTTTIKNQESKLQSEIGMVSEQILDDAAAQARINQKVDEELEKIENLSNNADSESKEFQKELKVKMDADKAAAHDEVLALAAKTKLEFSIVRGEMNQMRQDQAIAVSAASGKLMDALVKHGEAQDAAHAGMAADLANANAAVAGKLDAAKSDFAAKINTLANTITANNGAYERRMEEVTGVVHDWKHAADADRANLREITDAMDKDLNAKIERAITLGEAKMAKVEREAMAGIELHKRQSLIEMNSQIEAMADDIFSMVQENRQQLADNYLSLKAYAVAGKDSLEDYVTKGKGRNLGSIGDLLTTVSGMESVVVKKSEGLGAGADSLPSLFSGKKVTISDPVNKINFLADEYINTLTQVKARWPMGLGKYLLDKVERSMMDKGVLEVDNVEGKSGNFVFINGHAVGLSSKLSDFETLAVPMAEYENVLSHLTAEAVVKHPVTKETKEVTWEGKGQWQGDRR